MRPRLTIVLLAALAIAGCVTPANFTPGASDAAGTGADALAGPWTEGWSLREADFHVEYDPVNRHVVSEGTLVIGNDLNASRDVVTLLMEPLEITRLEDESGTPLEHEVRAFNTFPLTSELLGGFGNLQYVDVHLTGDVEPGATRALNLTLEGWETQTLDAGVTAPNEWTAFMHVGLVPMVTGTSWFSGSDGVYRLTFTHPVDWTVIPTANLVAEEVGGGRVTARYEIRHNYVKVFAAEGLEWLEDEVDGVLVRTHFYPDMRVQGRTVHDVTLRTLRLMPELTGEYPYEHLFTVPYPVTVNAFSRPGLSLMGLPFYRTVVPDVPVQFGRFTPYPAGSDGFEMVTVHEHVHNWWGHNVRGANFDFEKGPSDMWLVEGVTTYLSELVWFERMYGPEDAAASADGKVADQLARKRVVGEERAITEPGGDAYEKTALALRALEAYAIATGRPDAVLDALTAIQERYGKLQGGSGVLSTQEAFTVFEDVFGEDLSWHFEPWFLGSALTDFAVADVRDDGDAVTVTVQNQGDVPAAVRVHAHTATGRLLDAWGVVPAGEAVDVVIDKPAAAAGDPVVRVEADPWQHVYESDESNNAWAGTA